MSRHVRQFIVGTAYHLISRFVDRQWFISTEQEREHYLSLLGRALAMTDWRCLAYAIMSNHIHLAMIAGRDRLASWTRRVHSPFADSMNKAQDRIGGIFVRGPKDVLIPQERLPTLLAYIHNNPVRAGIAPDASCSSWTSHRAYIGAAPVPRWLNVDEGLQLSGGNRVAFDALVRSAPSAIDGDKCDALTREFDPNDELLMPVSVESVVEIAAAEVGLSIDELRSRRKQPLHVLARRVVSRCGDRFGVSGVQIARALCTTPQCVSKILARPAVDETEMFLIERVLQQL